MPETSEPVGRRRFARFSLLSFLLLTGLIGVSVSHFRLTAEVRQLKLKNSELRNEIGYLEITDPKKVYVKPLESLDALTWRVRVYLPPNKPYYVQVAHEWVDQGVPRFASGCPIQSHGEFTLTAGLCQDASGRWQLRDDTAILLTNGRCEKRNESHYSASRYLPHGGHNIAEHRRVFAADSNW